MYKNTIIKNKYKFMEISINIQFKICSKCKKMKNVNRFYKHNNFKDGYRYECKKCNIKSSTLKKREILFNRSKMGIKLCSKCKIEKDINNFGKYNKSNDGYRYECKKCRKQYQQKHTEEKREYDIKYRQKHKKILNENKKQYNKIKRFLKPHFKLKQNISSLINQRLKRRLSSKNGKSTFNFLPYTINELKQHLEQQFAKGMSWNNYGLFGWHIDHIKPDFLFNYKSVEDKEFQECWALKNLQPLWAKDNLSKGNKY